MRIRSYLGDAGPTYYIVTSGGQFVASGSFFDDPNGGSMKALRGSYPNTVYTITTYTDKDAWSADVASAKSILAKISALPTAAKVMIGVGVITVAYLLFKKGD